jgi:hypothetical protein
MTNTKTESCDEEKARPLDGVLCNVKEIEEVLQYARSAWVQSVRTGGKPQAPVDYEEARSPGLLRRPWGLGRFPSREM